MAYRKNELFIALFFVLQTLTLSSCAYLSTLSTGTATDVEHDFYDGPPEELTAKSSGANRLQLTDSENSLYSMPIWQLSGRLAIRSNDEVLSGSLLWRQQQRAFVINFNAPFGQGALQIKGNEVGVELQTADGHSLEADDIDQLFEEAAGWELPLSGLRYWVFGVPSPDSQATLQREPVLAQVAQVQSEQEKPLGQIIEIRQSDWVVKIPRRVQVGERSLPRKLQLSSPDLRVRLVVDQWQLN